MGLEKKAALVCVVILLALFVVGLSNREQRSVPNGPTEAHRAETRRILAPLDLGKNEEDTDEPGEKSAPEDDGENEVESEVADHTETDSMKTEFRLVKVQHRDNFSRIAQRELGAANLYPILIKANPNLKPRSLREGQDVRIPVKMADLSASEVKAPQTNSDKPRDYLVKRDETLSGIAQSHYGKASHWKKIFAANRQKLRRPESLRFGMTIRLP